MGAVVGVLAAMSGCSEARSGLGAGQACVRSTECASGLACIGGQCTDDLSGVQGEPPAVLPPTGEGGVDGGMEAGAEAGTDAGSGGAGGGMEGGMGAGGMDAGAGGMGG